MWDSPNFYLSVTEIHSQWLKSWETSFPLNILHSPPLQCTCTPPFELESRPTPSCCNAVSRPVLQSHLSARQTSVSDLKYVYVSVWLHSLSEAVLMLWGLPLLWGEYSAVCFEICDHWTVSSHRRTDPIINSLRLITFADGTLASFCYWMRWPYCTFVSRAVLQNDLLQYAFYLMH